MSKIEILSEEVCVRINAGEVIDRPYSVVKELVENSIDAGATEIEIYIEKGGKDLIKVVDNGCGIEYDDMRTAFISHATSKITTLEDIAHIHTLGFRGEALATIASVAYVEMLSSIDGEEGYTVSCDGDYYPGKVSPAVTPKGTTVAVRNLFFNTPVRYKFLKQDKKEETDITTYVTRYILGNPEISFRYYINGQLALQSFGEGLAESISKIYGANCLPRCFKISAMRNDIKVSGFIGNQNFFKANKNYQTTFLNGRYISNQLISSAIHNAYSPYIMKRQYPFYVLFIEMPDDMIDVNVHPNKQDVRFSNNQLVYGTIYKIISGILEGSASAAEYVEDEGKGRSSIYAKEYTSEENVQDSDFSDVRGIEQCKTYVDPVPQKSYNLLAAEELEKNMDMSVYENAPEPDLSVYDDPPRTMPIHEFFRADDCSFEPYEFVFQTDYPDWKQAKIDEYRREYEAQVLYWECKYRGTLFNTYLIYEKGSNIFLIDQHAAHERLVYDKLIEEIKNEQIVRQGMFVSHCIAVTPEERQFIMDRMQDLYKMGFGLEPFGINSFRVMDIPANFTGLDIDGFFKEFLSNIDSMQEIGLTDVFKDKIAQAACKHAIKGGETLTDEERDALFEKLKGDFGLKCPHGRPICVKMTKSQIERMFKRRM